mmetsp:Transcript_36486/g.79868  ORF Transcript_36486/g.79868 Transcript_36486/m.79868 type:complete len:377 (+) Transcript_36486:121-1251(+)
MQYSPLCSALVLLASAALGVDGHAYLAYPPMRGGVGGKSANSWCPQCGNGQGVCGDGGQWGSGSNFISVTEGYETTLTAGSTVEFVIKLTAHHKGHFEFAICEERVGPSTVDPQSCFDSNKLHRAPPLENCAVDDSRGDCQPLHEKYPERWYLPPGGSEHKVRYLIPADLECGSCTLQWRWRTANSCVPSPDYGCFFDQLRGLGWNADSWCGSFCGVCGAEFQECSNGEEFRNCANVVVSGGSPGETASEMPATQTSTFLATTSKSTLLTTASTTASQTSTVPITTSPAGTCLHNQDCATNPWCQAPGYDAWCLANGATCPSPHCRREEPPSEEQHSCEPVGNCGVIGFCDQEKYVAYCRESGHAGACPEPFCKPC